MNTVAKLDTGKASRVAPPVNEAAAMMELIARAAADPNVDVERMERLMQMHERIVARSSEKAFAEAMNKAQAEMRPISTDSANNSTRSRYTSYGALDKAMRPIYTANGFALSFDTAESPQPQHVLVLCHVTHIGGHKHTYQADIPCDGKGAKGGDVMSRTHANGSAFSYGQRYLLKLIFNIATGDDDDGNAAGGSSNTVPGCITPDQVQTINELMKRTNSDVGMFCTYYKIEAVPDLPAARYSHAIEMLNLQPSIKKASAAKQQ